MRRSIAEFERICREEADAGEMVVIGQAPRRIQLSRKKGFRLPPNTVVVSRPSKWGNPYHLKDGLCKSKAEAVTYYDVWLRTGVNYVSDKAPPSHEDIRRELRGKNLACWCKPGDACHADVLLEIANSGGKS